MVKILLVLLLMLQNNTDSQVQLLYFFSNIPLFTDADDEITFEVGDIITHVKATHKLWWEGRGPNGKYGLFPANFVEIVHRQVRRLYPIAFHRFWI